MSEGFGPGVNGPFLAVVDAHTVNADAGALAPLVDAQSQPEPAPAPEGAAPEDGAPEDAAPDQPQPDQPAAEAEPEIAPAAEVVDTSADAADNSSPEDKAALASFLYTADQLKGLGGVKHAQIVGLSKDQRAAQIMVTPETASWISLVAERSACGTLTVGFVMSINSGAYLRRPAT